MDKSGITNGMGLGQDNLLDWQYSKNIKILRTNVHKKIVLQDDLSNRWAKAWIHSDPVLCDYLEFLELCQTCPNIQYKMSRGYIRLKDARYLKIKIS